MASILKVNTIQGASTAGSIEITGECNSTTTNLKKGLCMEGQGLYIGLRLEM